MKAPFMTITQPERTRSGSVRNHPDRRSVPGFRTAGLALLLSITVTSSAASDSARQIVLPDAFAYPNGIARAADGALYVGSVTSGNILRLEATGAAETWFRETDTIFAGTALRFDPSTDILWVASPDFLGQEVNGERVRRPHRIAAINGTTGEAIWSSEMPDGGFANDIVPDGQGGVFVTDTLRDLVLYLAGPGAPFEILADGPELSPGDIGPAGIVVLPDGDLIVGLYSDGRLLRITPNEAGARIAPLELTRRIENPDGLALAPDGRLLVLEGAVESGNGKLLAIDLSGAGPLAVEALVEGLDMPLNLTLFDDGVAITEGRLRHMMLDDPSLPIPDSFRIVIVELDEG